MMTRVDDLEEFIAASLFFGIQLRWYPDSITSSNQHYDIRKVEGIPFQSSVEKVYKFARVAEPGQLRGTAHQCLCCARLKISSAN